MIWNFLPSFIKKGIYSSGDMPANNLLFDEDPLYEHDAHDIAPGIKSDQLFQYLRYNEPQEGLTFSLTIECFRSYFDFKASRGRPAGKTKQERQQNLKRRSKVEVRRVDSEKAMLACDEVGCLMHRTMIDSVHGLGKDMHFTSMTLKDDEDTSGFSTCEYHAFFERDGWLYTGLCRLSDDNGSDDDDEEMYLYLNHVWLQASTPAMREWHALRIIDDLPVIQPITDNLAGLNCGPKTGLVLNRLLSYKVVDESGKAPEGWVTVTERPAKLHAYRVTSMEAGMIVLKRCFPAKCSCREYFADRMFAFATGAHRRVRARTRVGVLSQYLIDKIAAHVLCLDEEF